jgi:hypothetical protein
MIALLPSAGSAIPAFPGAEGWGTETPGGRGGRVILVTNTNASGAGSLLAAFIATGPRIIVFRVSGTINLPGVNLRQTHSHVTVAGQTSPAGVTLTNTFNGNNIMTSYHENFNNAVFRFLRLRGLSNNTDDCASFNTCDNMVFDHCEFSGGQDESFSLPANHDVTLQWCAVHNSTPNTGGSGWGGTLMGYLPTSHISIHHNLWAHNFARYPGLHWGDQQPPDSGKIDLRNNIVYNTQRTYAITTGFTGTLWANSVGNLFIEGPSSEAIQNQLTMSGTIYARDNYNYLLSGAQVDLCSGAGLFRSYGDMRYGDTVSTPWPTPSVTTFTSAQAYDSVLAKVGALPRDTMMRRTIEEAYARTGEVKTYTYDLLDYAPLPSDPGPAPPADADLDGMPDFWEDGVGLDKNSASDNTGDLDGDGYTNIEEYINDLALARLCQDYYNTVYPIPNDWPDYNPSCCKSLAVERSIQKTGRFELSAAPNPFHTAVAITVNGHAVETLHFQGKRHGNIKCNVSTMSVYDTHGRMIDRIAPRDGRTFTWSAGNMPAGIYIARLTVGKKTLTKPLFTIALLFCVSAFSGPIEDLQPGNWYEVPNSHLYDVRPSGYSANVIGPWCSGAMDTKRDRLIVWGGGHGDYVGNEIYVFDLNTLAWERLNDPSDPPAVEVPHAPDGGPCSRHTYEYIDYVPNIDRFCSFGGSGFWQSGQTGTDHTDCFDFETLKWEERAVTPGCGGRIGATSAYDPSTGYIWYHGTASYSWPAHWDPLTDSWTVHGKTWTMESMSYYVTMEIDPLKKKMVACGGGDFHLWDISVDTGWILYGSETSSGSGVNGAASPGLAYDPVTEKIIGWRSGQTVYSLDLDNNTWTSHSASGANPGSPCGTGTFGRFRYCPNKNVFVVVNSNTANVFIYRHTAASSAPQWYLDLIEPPPTAVQTPVPVRDNGTGLTVSPNPFHAAVAITVNGNAVETLHFQGKRHGNIKCNVSTMSVYDTHGRMIDRIVSRDGTFSWNASGMPAGVYLARAGIGGKIFQKKLFLVK